MKKLEEKESSQKSFFPYHQKSRTPGIITASPAPVDIIKLHLESRGLRGCRWRKSGGVGTKKAWAHARGCIY